MLWMRMIESEGEFSVADIWNHFHFSTDVGDHASTVGTIESYSLMKKSDNFSLTLKIRLTILQASKMHKFKSITQQGRYQRF